MDQIDRSEPNKRRKTLGIGAWIAIVLIVTQTVIMLALFFSRSPEQDTRHGTVLVNTARVVEMVSRMRINLLKSADLKKDAVMAMTDEESQAFAQQSHESADAVERDLHELKGLIDAAKMDNEMNLMKEFSDNWSHLQRIDRELLALAVENTNIKAANLSYTAAAPAVTKFEQLLARLIDIPTSDSEQAKVAKLAYQAATTALMIYSLEAPHINEAQDQKMDELENLMGANEKKVRNALRNLSHLADQHGGILLKDASSTFSKFMEVHQEVLRLSRLNTNIKSLELSLGRKRKVTAQCEEILNSLQDAVQGRSFKATR